MATKKQSPKKLTVDQLLAENNKLKKENDKLAKKRSLKAMKSKGHKAWKTAIVIFAAGLAGALLLVGNLLFWGGNTLVSTDRFVAVTSPLIKQPAIQTAVASYTTDQFFSRVNVQAVIAQVLPPRADFIAPTLSSQLKTTVNAKIKSLLQNSSVQNAWTQALTKSHSSIIKLAKSYQGDGDINLNDFYKIISNKLATTNLSFLANKTLPPKFGEITVVKAPWLPKLHKLVTDIGWYQAITTALFVVLSAVAVWFAKNRRKMAVVLGLMYSLIMLLSIVAIRVTEHNLISGVKPAYQSAASEAATVITRPLIVQSVTIFLIGLLIALVAWLSGNSKSAITIKHRLQDILSGRLHKAVFGDNENGLTKWVGAHKALLQWLYVGLIALIMLIVTLSPKLILFYAILVLLGVIVIEFLAAKKQA